MEKEIAIRVRNLSKMYKLYRKQSDRLKDALGLLKKDRYTESMALSHVDLEIRRGETVGIIGTNGSGKSTILKIITGVLTPSEGEVEVDGHISALLELGAGFNMEYNGIDNIFLNGMMIGFSEEEIKARMDDILAFADIGDYVYQPVKTYSSGMFVRLAFAVAISIDPEILIVDEALSVGDVFFQAKCYHKFEEFKNAGKTILFVSHDLSSISKYCDRAVLLNKGVKLGEGAPKEMIDIYKQVLVGLYPIPEMVKEAGKTKTLLDDEELKEAAKKAADRSPETETKDENVRNPAMLTYGDSSAQIVDYYVMDAYHRRVASVTKGQPFRVGMKVEFKKNLPAPIFAFTIKNVMGIEITGTNTMLEKAFTEPVKKGDKIEVTFDQEMTLQGGEYLISFGVTGFEQNDFAVYHRLYDALNLSVVSDKNTVGYYDMESKVVVKSLG